VISVKISENDKNWQRHKGAKKKVNIALRLADNDIWN